ncbi:MAG: glutamate--tRNA ligase [Candidatus Omnitrophota bacterium]
MIKVRFAPSPTGFLHIGGARTALFNYMYARAQKGSFVLRIEDTDRQRSRPEYLEEILESMAWLGLEWDELYKQSQRFDIYWAEAEKLLSVGKAYREGDAIIMAMPQQEIVFYDVIRGAVCFDTSTIKDQVLMKSDGSPTYGFACVVDDAQMGITHVVRGEDHISNTPKQIAIYQAMELKPPKFAHLPLIMDEAGGRMSKRTGATAVSDYRKMGFLPEALVNYLMLLGWSPGGDQEILTLKNAIKKFSIKKVNKTSAAFSMDKLRWINAQYFKQMPDSELAQFVRPHLQQEGLVSQDYDGKLLEHIVKLYKSRMADVLEFIARTRYIFADNVEIERTLRQEQLTPEKTQGFMQLAEALDQIQEFNAQSAEEAFRNYVRDSGTAMKDLVHPVRVALTGSEVGPSLFDTMAVLGKKKTVNRLRCAYQQQRGDA